MYCRNVNLKNFDPLGAECKCEDCVCYHEYYPNWYNNDYDDSWNKIYFMGRDGIPLINPSNPVTNYLEDRFPNAHYFAIVHDSWVDRFSSYNLWDWATNIPSMPFAFAYAFAANSLDSFSGLLDIAIDAFKMIGVNISYDTSLLEPVRIYDCKCE